MTATILKFLNVRERSSDGARPTESAPAERRAPESRSVDASWLDRYLFDRESREELETALVR